MGQDPREGSLGWIQQLAAIERPSASEGERQAGQWIVEQLAAAATPARIDTEAAPEAGWSRTSRADAAGLQILQRGIADHVSPEIAKFMSVVFALDDERDLEELIAGSGFHEVSARRGPKMLRLPPPEDFLWQYVWSTPLAEAVGSISEQERESLSRDVVAAWDGLTQHDALIIVLDVLTVMAKRAG